MAYIKFYERRIKSRASLKECVEFNFKDEDLCIVDGKKLIHQFYLDNPDKAHMDAVYKSLLGGQGVWDKEKTEEYVYIIFSWDTDQIWPEEALDLCKVFHEEFMDEFPALIAIHEDKHAVHAHVLVRKIDYFGERIKFVCKDWFDFEDKYYGHKMILAENTKLPYEFRTYFDMMHYLMY